jgi:hypothetical protein
MRLSFKHTWADRVQAVLRRRRSPPSADGAAPAATVPVTAEWDEAFSRVESYLRAHRIDSRVQLNRLTTEIMEAARALAANHPDEPPVTIALQITHARIGEWLVHAVGQGDWADERFRAQGRLAILLADIPRRCPECFLAHDEMPAELRAQLGGAQFQPGPEVRLTRMPSTPLEFPLAGMVGEKWETFSRSIFVRAATSWLLIAGFLGFAWFATH